MGRRQSVVSDGEVGTIGKMELVGVADTALIWYRSGAVFPGEHRLQCDDS